MYVFHNKYRKLRTIIISLFKSCKILNNNHKMYQKRNKIIRQTIQGLKIL
jgi:hypothetical protein